MSDILPITVLSLDEIRQLHGGSNYIPYPEQAVESRLRWLLAYSPDPVGGVELSWYVNKTTGKRWPRVTVDGETIWLMGFSPVTRPREMQDRMFAALQAMGEEVKQQEDDFQREDAADQLAAARAWDREAAAI